VFPNIVVWTAHERSTQDKISGEKLVGPEAAGEAITANLPRHFNNTLHFVTASSAKEKVKDNHTEAMVIDLDVGVPRLHPRPLPPGWRGAGEVQGHHPRWVAGV
jgi:hypothetical protein